MARAPECVDCIREGVTSWRPIVEGCGPRTPLCQTHKRARKRRTSERAHERHVAETYEIDPELYWALYHAQGGRCYVCQVARGTKVRLAVEHDHVKAKEECGHDPKRGCLNCIRCLSCKRCNKLVAFLGPDALARAITLHLNPPAQRFFAGEELSELCPTT